MRISSPIVIISRKPQTGSDFGFHSNELFFRMAFVDFDGEKVIEAYKKEKKIDELFIKENCLSIYKGIQQLIKFTREIG